MGKTAQLNIIQPLGPKLLLAISFKTWIFILQSAGNIKFPD